jgi:hypothetical protein
VYVADEKNTAVRAVRLSDGFTTTLHEVPIEPRTVALSSAGHILIDGYDVAVTESTVAFELQIIDPISSVIAPVTSYAGMFGVHADIVSSTERIILARNWCVPAHSLLSDTGF